MAKVFFTDKTVELPRAEPRHDACLRHPREPWPEDVEKVEFPEFDEVVTKGGLHTIDGDMLLNAGAPYSASSVVMRTIKEARRLR